MADESTLAAVHLIVEGEVQGVGFRAFTRSIAFQLGLVGWVRNEIDGTVEIWAEGPRPSLQRLIEAVRRGPSGGFVTDLQIRWGTPQGNHPTFRIRYE